MKILCYQCPGMKPFRYVRGMYSVDGEWGYVQVECFVCKTVSTYACNPSLIRKSSPRLVLQAILKFQIEQVKGALDDD